MGKTITPFPTPGIVDLIQLTGIMEGWHYCAKTKLHKRVFSKRNSIYNDLKDVMRDNMYAPTDFALDNMFGIDGQKYGDGGHESGDPVGKDGIIIYDQTNAYWLTMVTAVHPTDPSGNYYRQWQGVLTNNYGVGSFVIGSYTSDTGATIGVSLNGTLNFSYKYAYGPPATTTMAENDILTVNWKIAVG